MLFYVFNGPINIINMYSPQTKVVCRKRILCSEGYLLKLNVYSIKIAVFFVQCLRTLVGHTGGVWSSQMCGCVVISGSTDRTLKVWNADTGQCKHTLYGHTSTVRCMSLHGNKLVTSHLVLGVGQSIYI